MTDAPSDLADRYARRVLALIGHCPVGKSLKAQDTGRFADCSRKRGKAELRLKVGLRSDVTGRALLHARFRIGFPFGREPVVVLHHLEGRRETDELTVRQEKFLSALMTWAEQVLPDVTPTEPGPRTPLWQRQFAELYHRLSGRSLASARRRLREGFFVDQEDTSESMRIDSFLELLSEEGWVALVDWKEETIDELVQEIARQRLAAARVRSVDTIDPASLAEAGYAIVSLEDGSDGSTIAILARDDIETVAQLLGEVAPHIVLRA